MAADKIGMRMRLDHVLDLLSVCFRFVQILLNIPLRIDDRGFALRAEVVRRVREATEVELLKLHHLVFRLYATTNRVCSSSSSQISSKLISLKPFSSNRESSSRDSGHGNCSGSSR